MFAWQFATMLDVSRLHGWTPFVSMQNHYNLVYREEEREMLPLCRDRGIAVIPWSPLARGFLAGNRNKADKGDTSRARPGMRTSCIPPTRTSRRGRSGRRIAAARRQTDTDRAGVDSVEAGVTAPIVGASKIEHLDDHVGALAIRLEPDEVALLEAPYQPHRVLGHT
jgi:aryl-alcohol dehydrogenase (NADP+)